ncbi:cyclopropane-fatty-acyl-phospholipid synthase family protein [Phytomonospora sp. NPDC050363]|uniref:cyclopropane-fatty-acyl-phospholipid synthase family protein n=1 Tax=Phytomonospora sp. NPDC050363 TaxID=3155642 RepID=UPI0033EF71CD
MQETANSTETARRESATRGIAGHVTATIEAAFGIGLPVAVRAWDGSVSGPSGEPTVVIRSPRAIRYLLWRPGELGLARAYVMGEIDIDGDFRRGFQLCREFTRRVRDRGLPRPTSWPAVLALFLRLGAVGPPPVVPGEEARLRGRPNSPGRDRAAIAHHYDLGNDFYAMLLDPAMVYSSGYWTSEAADYRLADAQRDKLDLVCRELRLRKGMRLLDLGCGWGSLILHAAENYGVHATGVTISARQEEFIRARVADRGLHDLVDVRLQDYREVTGTNFDAVASIEMGEHVGERNYPVYCATLRGLLRPGGRLLLQQMSRGAVSPGGGAFIESYIAADMTMRPLASTLGYLETAGLEVQRVRAMREHYRLTIDAWSHRLDDVWDEMVHRFGARRARIWRLYLIGGGLAFGENRMSVHQILATRGDAGAIENPPDIGAGKAP